MKAIRKLLFSKSELTPMRIQRRRMKGWRMPFNTVYVGRGSHWGNPYVVGKHGTAEQCVERYKAMMTPYTKNRLNNTVIDFMLAEDLLEEIRTSLRGKNLACYCKVDQPCHADVLIRLANEE